MKQTKYRFGMNIGILSLLMVFIVLCLTVFAILAYSTVSADSKLSEKSNEYILSYYAAENDGQKLLYDLDQILLEAKRQASSQEEYDLELQKALAIFSNDSVSYDVQTRILRYNKTINERTVLIGQIQLNGFDATQRYTVLSWKAEPVTDDSGESQTQNLWNGEIG